jgi:hypothetical protein
MRVTTAFIDWPESPGKLGERDAMGTVDRRFVEEVMLKDGAGSPEIGAAFCHRKLKSTI